MWNDESRDIPGSNRTTIRDWQQSQSAGGYTARPVASPSVSLFDSYNGTRRSRTSARSSGPSTGNAPSRIRRFVPTDVERSTSPGTAYTGTP